MSYSELIHPWEGATEPFRIFGNLYFVGTRPGSTHIIDTGDGLIMIDPGYPQTLYLVLENMHRFGFSAKDVKYIVITHGHYDHLGAVRALVALSGAKTFIGAPDAPYADGSVDLTWAKELGMEYHEAFTPDVLLSDGDKICLGNTEILCRAAPGHTPGTMAFFFDVTDGKQTLRAAMHGGIGTNSMKKKFLDSYGLGYEIREQFVPAIERIIDEKVDILLGNHVWNNDTIEKGRMITGDNNPFIDPGAWSAFLRKTIASYEKMIAAENSAK